VRIDFGLVERRRIMLFEAERADQFTYEIPVSPEKVSL
jgi:hypothetical protein